MTLKLKEKYFIVELIKTEKIQRKIENNSVRKKILLDQKFKYPASFLKEKNNFLFHSD